MGNAGACKERPARRRGHDALRRALNQTHMQFGFQIAHAFSDRRLRDAKLACRAANTSGHDGRPCAGDAGSFGLSRSCCAPGGTLQIDRRADCIRQSKAGPGYVFVRRQRYARASFWLALPASRRHRSSPHSIQECAGGGGRCPRGAGRPHVCRHPARTPREIIARVADGIANVVASQDVGDRLIAAGMDPDAQRGPDAFDKLIRSETTRWAGVVRDAGIKAE